MGRSRLSEKTRTCSSGRFSKISRISGASFSRLSVWVTRALEMPRRLAKSAWVAQVPYSRKSLRMSACFTGLVVGAFVSLVGAVGSVPAGSTGDTKNAPFCSLERSIQKARSKKFVNPSDAGSQSIPDASGLGLSLRDAPVQHRPGRRHICLPMRDLHHPPFSTVFSCYETVANLQPGGVRQVSGLPEQSANKVPRRNLAC